VGHKVDLYDTAAETSRSGRIVRYDPGNDKHLVAFDPPEEEEGADEGKSKAPARKWVTLRVRSSRDWSIVMG
jgi:hypothetical protein